MPRRDGWLDNMAHSEKEATRTRRQRQGAFEWGRKPRWMQSSVDHGVQ